MQSDGSELPTVLFEQCIFNSNIYVNKQCTLKNGDAFQRQWTEPFWLYLHIEHHIFLAVEGSLYSKNGFKETEHYLRGYEFSYFIQKWHDIKVDCYIFKGSNSASFILPPFYMKVNSKRKKFCSLRSSFLLEQ